MTSEQLFDGLRSLYPEAHGWALLPQVRDTTGIYGSRTADGVAMNTWPSRGLEVHGLELKVTRGDWLRELKKPAKADRIFKYCDRWSVVIPEHASLIVQPAELPSNWGLIVVDGKGKASQQRPAPKLKPAALDKGFLAAILRRLAACGTPEAKISASFARGLLEGREEGKREALARLERRGQREEVRWQRESLERLEEIAGRCLKGIRRELGALKELPDILDDAELPPPEANPPVSAGT